MAALALPKTPKKKEDKTQAKHSKKQVIPKVGCLNQGLKPILMMKAIE